MQRSPMKTDGVLPQSLQRVRSYFLIVRLPPSLFIFDSLSRPVSLSLLSQVNDLEGVVEVRDAHFWTLCTGAYLGSMRLDIQEGSDSTHLVAMARSILKQAGITDVIIEVTVID